MTNSSPRRHGRSAWRRVIDEPLARSVRPRLRGGHAPSHTPASRGRRSTGLPGSDASSQNRKVRVPGSPSGQQQVTIRPYGRGAGGATRTGGGTETGRGAKTAMWDIDDAPPAAAINPGTGQRRQGRAGHPARGGPPRRSSAGAIAADRRWSRRQIQPMRLADHRIFRNTQPPAYLGGRQPLIPKRPQPDNRLFGPLHLVVPPTVQPQDTVSLWALGSTTHCRAATKTCGKPIAHPNPLGSAR